MGITVNGEKPKVTPVENFQLEDYMGKWYNIANLPFFWQVNGSKDGTAEYDLKTDKSGKKYVKVVNSETLPVIPIRNSATGQATVDDEANGKGLLTVSFKPFGEPITNQGNYIVLDTDYKNYAFVWSCRESKSWFGDKISNKPALWILSRQKCWKKEDVKELINSACAFVSKDNPDYDIEKIKNSMNIMQHSCE